VNAASPPHAVATPYPLASLALPLNRRSNLCCVLWHGAERAYTSGYIHADHGTCVQQASGRLMVDSRLVGWWSGPKLDWAPRRPGNPALRPFVTPKAHRQTSRLRRLKPQSARLSTINDEFAQAPCLAAPIDKHEHRVASAQRSVRSVGPELDMFDYTNAHGRE
jgi:hypothetical protein